MQEGRRWLLDDQNQTFRPIVLIFDQNQGCIDGPWNVISFQGGHRTWVGNSVQFARCALSDKQNLYHSQIYLENSIDIQLQQQIISVVNSDDGGPMFWHVMQQSLCGAATAKMIKVQKIINETKLTDVPGFVCLFVCLLGNFVSSGFNPSCVFALYSIEGS